MCRRCVEGLQAAPPRVVGAGFTVWPAFRHRGLARRLVHDLKYRGVAAIADTLAAAMADHLPTTTAMLVPVPRVLVRRVRLGVDPGVGLARAIGRRCGIPVVEAVQAPLWRPGQAGKGRGGRSSTAFGRRRPVWDAVLIDDVVTTGGTLAAAAGALESGVIAAVTATGVSV